MMSFAAFASAVLALLLSPGPTNVLMALAGAQGGWRRVLLFVPAALAGYLAVVVPLAWLGAEMLGRWPLLAVGLKLAAAGWVMVLWPSPTRSSSRSRNDRMSSAFRRLMMTE